MSPSAPTIVKRLTYISQDAFKVLHPPSTNPVPCYPDSDQLIIAQLHETLGHFFADKVVYDRDWAVGILSGSTESS